MLCSELEGVMVEGLRNSSLADNGRCLQRRVQLGQLGTARHKPVRLK